jgi:hypothetical protein
MTLAAAKRREQKACMQLAIADLKVDEAKTAVEQLQSYLPREILQGDLSSLEVLLMLKRLRGKVGLLLAKSLDPCRRPTELVDRINRREIGTDDLKSIQFDCRLGILLLRVERAVCSMNEILQCPDTAIDLYISLSLECRQPFTEVERIVDQLIENTFDENSALALCGVLKQCLSEVENLTMKHQVTIDTIHGASLTTARCLMRSAALRALAAVAVANLILLRLQNDDGTLRDPHGPNLKGLPNASLRMKSALDEQVSLWIEASRVALSFQDFNLDIDRVKIWKMHLRDVLEAATRADCAASALDIRMQSVLSSTEDDASRVRQEWVLLYEDNDSADDALLTVDQKAPTFVKCNVMRCCGTLRSAVDSLVNSASWTSEYTEKNVSGKEGTTSSLSGDNSINKDAKLSPWQKQAMSARRIISSVTSVRAELETTKNVLQGRVEELRVAEKKMRMLGVKQQQVEAELSKHKLKAAESTKLRTRLDKALEQSAAEALQSEQAMRALSEEIEGLESRNRLLMKKIKEASVVSVDGRINRGDIGGDRSGKSIDPSHQQMIRLVHSHLSNSAKRWRLLAFNFLVNELEPLTIPMRASSKQREDIRSAMAEVAELRLHLQQRRARSLVVKLPGSMAHVISKKSTKFSNNGIASWEHELISSGKLLSRYKAGFALVQSLFPKRKGYCGDQQWLKNVQFSSLQNERAAKKLNSLGHGKAFTRAQHRIGRVLMPSTTTMERAGYVQVFHIRVGQLTLSRLHRLFTRSCVSEDGAFPSRHHSSLGAR